MHRAHDNEATRRPIGLWTRTALILVLALGGVMPQIAAQEMSPQAAEQIAWLHEMKRQRSPAQKRIDSRLLLELEARRGQPLLERLPALEVPRHADAEGRVLVDLDAAVDQALLAEIEALGGTVHSAFARWQAIRAKLPLDRLEELAASPRVRSIRPADVYMTQGTVTSEGDVAHGADTARVEFGVDGTGVRVGALSDSVDALAALQAAGELPAEVTVLDGQSGNPGTSEGTALLEIVHDMAPGAELFFATAAGGQAQMAQNILDLQAAGCDVIVDDVIYFTEPVFQDGIIAQAVDEVAASNVMYFSAAGNSGNLLSGTSGVFEGDFQATALPAPLAGTGVAAHDFGGASSNEITVDPPVMITLQWADPHDASVNDYDLYLLDAGLNQVLGASTNTQDGTQDPVESIDSEAFDDTGNRLVVVKFGGADRFFHLNTHRGQLAAATDGQIFGHPAAEGAHAVGAVDVAQAGGGVFFAGPEVTIEPFSSDGPRRIFFDAGGNALPGASLLGEAPGDTRFCPFAAGANRVSTSTPGFETFPGTSAAAPHLAGLSALGKQLLSSLTIKGMESRLSLRALDFLEEGQDFLFGFGIPIAGDYLDGPIGFQGDLFSFFPAMKSAADPDCVIPHLVPSSLTTFDGEEHQLFFSVPVEAFSEAFQGNPEADEQEMRFKLAVRFINLEGSSSGQDLFPSGFTDPETGLPLVDVCLEIGMLQTDFDDLTGDEPVDVVSAAVQFSTPEGTVFPEPVDITEAFGTFPWNGQMSVSFPGLVGLGIIDVDLNILVKDSAPPLFADGFESGDASSWTEQVP